MTNIKCKNMMYEQQLAHLTYKNINDLYTAIETKVKPKRMAMILHDKDKNDKGNPVADNVHVMMSFSNARSINSIAKLIGDKPQYIAAWNDKATNGFAYLVHRTENAKSKHQYDPSEVKANFDYIGELAKIEQSIQKANKRKSKHSNIDKYLDDIYNGDLTGKELEKMIDGHVFAKYQKQIKAVEAKRLEREADAFNRKRLEENRALRVYWLYGKKGTGKSSIAKEIAKKENRDYFISGSSKDMFQEYYGEHTIILEELRPGVIPYADLLKITDPYAESVSAPARYHDKYLAADLIIITSPYSPINFYKDPKCSINDKVDSFGQLERRITLSIKADQDAYYLAEFDSFKEEYKTDLNTKCFNPYSEKSRALSGTPKKNPVDLFNELTADVTTNGNADTDVNEDSVDNTDTN